MNIPFLKKKNNTSSLPKEEGFTIVETLVAIFILLISTTGPLTFAQSGLRASFLARDQIVAFYLAQDVVENIKNRRDNTALDAGLRNGGTWLSKMGTYCTPSGNQTKVCGMSVTDIHFNTEICDEDDGCGQLYFVDSDNEFTIESDRGGAPSKYSRTVYLTEIETNREAQIIVVVKWDSNFFSDRSVIVQENMYNWIPEYTN